MTEILLSLLLFLALLALTVGVLDGRRELVPVRTKPNRIDAAKAARRRQK